MFRRLQNNGSVNITPFVIPNNDWLQQYHVTHDDGDDVGLTRLYNMYCLGNPQPESKFNSVGNQRFLI